MLMEGPEHGIYFRGSATLQDGEVVLEVPESFRMVAREEGLTVTVTPTGPSRGLYVASKSLAGILVRENSGGTGDASFDFLVMGTRSAMPEHVSVRKNVHFAPTPGVRIHPKSLPGRYGELMVENGTLSSDGRVDEVTAQALGWRLENGRWTGGPTEGAPIADTGTQR